MSAQPESATLVFVDDRQPGITRRAGEGGWTYHDASGAQIVDAAVLRRLAAVALPPAYGHAWFCPDPNGHLLATGIDARGRKQYRYHPAFRKSRECAKFDGLAQSGGNRERKGRHLRAAPSHSYQFRLTASFRNRP